MGLPRVDELGELHRRLLRHASEDLLRVEFFSRVMDTLLEFCKCSAASLLLRDGEGLTRWQADARTKARLRIADSHANGWILNDDETGWSFDDLCRAVLLGRLPASRGLRSPRGGVVDSSWPAAGKNGRLRPCSVAVMPLEAGVSRLGVLGILESAPHAFDDEALGFFEAVADAVAVALAHHRVQWALRERVKELSCLYGISRIADQHDISEATALQRIVEVIPPGWQYPEITSAAIVLDGTPTAVLGSRAGPAKQEADVVVNGVKRGTVEVVYREQRPEFDEGPFLKEERNLIQAVARQIGAMLERYQAERERLQEQLRYADRLATAGRLAAGAAHELNEPLGAILGFAELARKHPKLPTEVDHDLERIVKASLHAREVIRQLMLFARQTPPQVSLISLHTVIREALSLVRGRLVRSGVRVDKRFARALPKVTADSAQLQQVIVNLVVNAVQAMPQGGTLTIGTSAERNGVKLTVQDTGKGMSEEITRQVFTPFFSTKDVGQGTGLGLSVAHGIVTAHGGTIFVESEPGVGTRFEILLPNGRSRDANTRRRRKDETGEGPGADSNRR